MKKVIKFVAISLILSVMLSLAACGAMPKEEELELSDKTLEVLLTAIEQNDHNAVKEVMSDGVVERDTDLDEVLDSLSELYQGELQEYKRASWKKNVGIMGNAENYTEIETVYQVITDIDTYKVTLGIIYGSDDESENGLYSFQLIRMIEE